MFSWFFGSRASDPNGVSERGSQARSARKRCAETVYDPKTFRIEVSQDPHTNAYSSRACASKKQGKKQLFKKYFRKIQFKSWKKKYLAKTGKDFTRIAKLTVITI